MKKQNKAWPFKRFLKYRVLKKYILTKVKLKFEVASWDAAYDHYEGAHRLSDDTMDLFDNRTAV